MREYRTEFVIKPHRDLRDNPDCWFLIDGCGTGTSVQPAAKMFVFTYMVPLTKKPGKEFMKNSRVKTFVMPIWTYEEIVDDNSLLRDAAKMDIYLTEKRFQFCNGIPQYIFVPIEEYAKYESEAIETMETWASPDKAHKLLRNFNKNFAINNGNINKYNSLRFISLL